jgi:hypothetical protein
MRTHNCLTNVYQVSNDIREYGAIYAYHKARDRHASAFQAIWFIYVAKSMDKHQNRRYSSDYISLR